jgi:hypothetical protein
MGYKMVLWWRSMVIIIVMLNLHILKAQPEASNHTSTDNTMVKKDKRTNP